jgi:hypothetical protein
MFTIKMYLALTISYTPNMDILMPKPTLEFMIDYLIQNGHYAQEDIDFMNDYEIRGAFYAETE